MRHVFRVFIFLFSVVGAGPVGAQNLVPNPSFETYSACPISLGQIALAPQTLEWRAPAEDGRATFDALGDGVRWISPPLERETEITGPMALKLWLSSSTIDADLFVTVMAFSPDGREVEFQGTVDPHTPLAQGWLRASHRKLDSARSLPYRPYHTHDDKMPLKPTQVYELDVEIWPMSIVLPTGFRLAVNIAGRDFERGDKDSNPAFRSRGSGPWIHDDPLDRPATVFAGQTTLHTGRGREACLLLPIIPQK